jgi:hemolysin III
VFGGRQEKPARADGTLGPVSPRAVLEYLLPDGLPRPRLRGWLHLGAVPFALGLGIALVIVAPAGRGTLAALVYAAAVVGLFTASGIYHRGRWTPGVRAWLQRVDHSMIFVLIAGTYTPVCVLVLDGALGTVLLAVVWAGALLGVLLQLLPIPAPRWLSVVVYVASGGWRSRRCPSSSRTSGSWPRRSSSPAACSTPWAPSSTASAPGSAPRVFGYHEVFHALTVVAAGLHYAVIAFWVLPSG